MSYRERCEAVCPNKWVVTLPATRRRQGKTVLVWATTEDHARASSARAISMFRKGPIRGLYVHPANAADLGAERL